MNFIFVVRSGDDSRGGSRRICWEDEFLAVANTVFLFDFFFSSGSEFRVEMPF